MLQKSQKCRIPLPYFMVDCTLVTVPYQLNALLRFRIFGWAVDSKRSPETENVILGATLELQRLQREELMEQQILRQQVRNIFNIPCPVKYHTSALCSPALPGGDFYFKIEIT